MSALLLALPAVVSVAGAIAIHVAFDRYYGDAVSRSGQITSSAETAFCLSP